MLKIDLKVLLLLIIIVVDLLDLTLGGQGLFLVTIFYNFILIIRIMLFLSFIYTVNQYVHCCYYRTIIVAGFFCTSCPQKTVFINLYCTFCYHKNCSFVSRNSILE